MQQKIQKFNNFGRSKCSTCTSFRPETLTEIKFFYKNLTEKTLITRGAGLSYSDCNLLENGFVIDTSRWNHFLNFDKENSFIEVEAGVKLSELLHFHQEYMPPVLPGSLNITVGGAIANDVHGKNNHIENTFGSHVKSITMLVKGEILKCSSQIHSDLFYATIGGLGLTGIILKAEIYLKKISKTLIVKKQKFKNLEMLLNCMKATGLAYDYQVAWLDWLNKDEKSVLSLAKHQLSNRLNNSKRINVKSLPKWPIKLVNYQTIKLYNKYVFNRQSKGDVFFTSFNNPLDKIQNWDYLYGAKGLVQFQAIIPEDKALDTLNEIRELTLKNKQYPLLVVLKYFTNKSGGLLSFVQPGFCIAIDFLNTAGVKNTIETLNELVLQKNGKVYLAKDLFLHDSQFTYMYPNNDKFKNIINKYTDNNFSSELAKRLGLIS